MPGYFGYFFERSDQVAALGTAAVVWIALYAIGGAISGREGIRDAYPIYGWGLVTLLFMLGGIFTPLSFTVMSVIAAIIAAIGAVFLIRRDGNLLSADLLKLTAVSLPLLVLVSAMTGSQWDEFSHWLPSARFLLETDGFPSAADHHTGSTLSAYPYGWPLLIYLASRLTGNFVESVGALLNVFLLLNFGLVIAGLIRDALAGDETSSGRKSWSLVALGALAVTILNPTFVQKLVLTSYSGVSTAVTTALACIICWRLLGALGRKNPKSTMSLAWQASLVFTVLVNVRQPNLVLFLLVVIALLIVILRDPDLGLRDMIMPALVMIVPPLIVYFAWRYHVTSVLPGQEFAIRPISGWNFDILPEVLAGMATVATKKGVYFGLMTIVMIVGLMGFIRPNTPLRRLALMASAVFVGYNAFLLFIYIAAFDRGSALSVTSYWRFSTHAGLVGLAVAAYGGGRLWRQYVGSWQIPPWQRSAVILVLIAIPFGFAEKLRFDREAPKPHLRLVAADVRPLISSDARLVILDPEGSGESGVITRFDIGRHATYTGQLNGAKDANVDLIRKMLKRGDPTHALVYSVTPAVAEALALPLKDSNSYLVRRTGGGPWRIIKTWQQSATN